jgi:hypothetical protein
MARQVEWTKRVEDWKRSGLEIAEFAQREGLSPKRLHWWCWKLGACPPPAEPPCLPVRGEEPSPPRAAVFAAPPAPAWIKIPLPNRCLLCVLPGVDGATLACVVAAAAELSAKDVVTTHPAPVTQVTSRQSRR